MYIFSNLFAYLTSTDFIFILKDLIEIILISSAVYYFSLWLKQDNKKNLLIYFYSFCVLGILSYSLELATITFLLYYSAPIILLMFIILHQSILQKNFVTLKKVNLEREPNNWFDELIRACLSALNNNKDILCVIERSDSICDFVQSSCLFYADLKKEIFETLINSQANFSKEDNFIWLNNIGKIVAVKANWNFSIDTEWFNKEVSTLPKWKQDCIIATNHTDAIAFKITPLSRTIDIFIQGKIIESVSPQQAFAIISKYLFNETTKEKIDLAATITNKNSDQKRR